jgi:hypothetical protein
MIRASRRLFFLVAICPLLTQCGDSLGSGNMGGPTVEVRNAKIAAEETGDFYYGRRYFVNKTRFWGYLKKPRESWRRAKLVIFNESQKTSPDRMPENGPPGQRYAFDQNYEYKIRGSYTGREVYEPNSNQFLPEFRLSGYEVVDRNPGWLFRPDDRYDSVRITLTPR